MKTKRARRYCIEMPFLFRRSGENEWREGKTTNISRSGVLFAASEPLEQDTAIEMRFSLPLDIWGQPAARVACSGHIVRTLPTPDINGVALLVATIARYRIVRPGRA